MVVCVVLVVPLLVVVVRSVVVVVVLGTVCFGAFTVLALGALGAAGALDCDCLACFGCPELLPAFVVAGCVACPPGAGRYTVTTPFVGTTGATNDGAVGERDALFFVPMLSCHPASPVHRRSS